MKVFGFICPMLLCFFAIAQKQDTFNSCLEKAKSQADLQVCAAEEFQRADAALNHTYQWLLAKAKSDPIAIEKIKNAQRAWLAFRDAHLDAMYPHEDKSHEYGTSYPMCVLLQKTELTRQRTKMLDKMLNPSEVDACDAELRYSKTVSRPPRPDSWPD